MPPILFVKVDVFAVPPMASVMQTIGNLADVVKVGEGSYGEAFRLAK